jgi:hypothetical protein
VLIGLDLGAMLGFELGERAAGEAPQAAIQTVDGIGRLERGELDDTIAQHLHGKLGSRNPAEPFANCLRNHDLSLAG